MSPLRRTHLEERPVRGERERLPELPIADQPRDLAEPSNAAIAVALPIASSTAR